MRRHRWAWVVAGGLALAGAGLAVWLIRGTGGPPTVVLEASPQSVLGSGCRLVAVGRETASVKKALSDAESTLRRIESLTDRWKESTPVARLNRAEAGVEVPLPAEVLAVLRFARQADAASEGAFDVTAAPLIGLWSSAGDRLRFPSADEIAATRSASSWEDFHLSSDGAIKAQGSARVDLSGLARGYGIDQAVAAMKAAGARSGSIRVGRDVRVFGKPLRGEVWDVPVPSPFDDDTLLTLRINEGAVSTVGDRRRDVEIEGQRVGQIVDPRTGSPAVMAFASTAVAADAMTAHAWAMALYVQGPVGVGLLPTGVDGLVVAGEEDAPKLWATPVLASATSDAGVRESLQILGRGAATSQP